VDECKPLALGFISLDLEGGEVKVGLGRNLLKISLTTIHFIFTQFWPQ
jgi:hypothetical protein